MKELVTSGLMAIAFFATLVFSAPILNDDRATVDELVSVKDSEMQTDKNIHIPL